jgi:hypothetical protein
MPDVPASLQALLSDLIDYAGLYPPAGLPLAEVTAKYEAYLASPERWMLNRLVLPAARLSEASLKEGWRITLLVEDEPGPLPAPIETLETKLARRLSLPTYCEAPLDVIVGGYAKVRTGGLTPEAIPAAGELADFLAGAAARRLPFKATAGLHHPLRSLQPLTYAAGAPRAVMHGFLNVFAAAAFVWHGLERDAALEILEERDVRAFDFRPGDLRYGGRALSVEQIRAARRDFAHSFGSCSFEEPVADLRQLGLLP